MKTDMGKTAIRVQGGTGTMKVNSVSGQIDTKDLGRTLMHEHIIAANHTMCRMFPDWYDHDEFIDRACRLIARAKRSGVRTIVDMTPFQLGRDARVLREVAEKAEMQIIACTGYHWFEDLCLIDKGSEFLAERLIKDIEVGMEGTDIKASLIKCATDRPGMSDFAKRLLKAAVIAHKATGAPLSTHTASPQGAAEQMAFFEAEGVDPKRVIIGHVGDTDDVSFLESVARRGFNIGHDRFGVDRRHPNMLSSEKRAETVAALCRAGYLKQIVMSHDAACFLDYWEGRENMGNPWQSTRQSDPEKIEFQFAFICETAAGWLKQMGLTQRELDTILIDTPRRIFESRTEACDEK
ncbi:MAG: hypothetical protein Q4C72_00905 [Eubacteriales bacterium]|nr:hypothetical protein [Eubacteriales bacterium]